MTEFLKEKNINLLGKDFQGFKRNLIKFSQAHHSGVFVDMNEASPGMAILELNAYIGSVLAFYIDRNFNEMREDTARQIENVTAIAKSKGYVPSGKRAARGTQAFIIEVPATTAGDKIVPDDLYTPILRSAKLAGPNGVNFETLEEIVFSASNADSPRMVTGSQFDSTTGLPTYFAIRKDAQIIAGDTKEYTVSVQNFQPFLQIDLPDPDVIEVNAVTDSDNNEWFEVDYLAQDTVFDVATNDASDNNVVPYVLKLRTVPRRFIKDMDPTTKVTSLIFGSGDGVNFDDELIPNLADLSLPLAGKRTFSGFALDPQNFLKTRSLGLSPFNTSLTIEYRTGGGSQTNVPAKSIKSVNEAVLDFSATGLSAAKKSRVISSLESINVEKTDGGGPEESLAEIKANSSAFFAAQSRIVTREDVIVRVKSLPAKFGKVDKVYVKRDNLNAQAFDIHVLSKDADGHLTQASPTLLKNITTYISRYNMMTDSINLLQTNIINLGIDFGVVISPKLTRSQVLAACLNEIRDYFNIDRWDTSQPIIITDLQAHIQSIYGVISVYKLAFRNIIGQQSGLSYSLTHFDVAEATSNGILYCPENSIFEVKFPTKDITGESK